MLKMKNLILIISCLAISFNLFSQRIYSNLHKPCQLNIGPTGGFCNSFLFPFDEYKMQPCWNAGLSAAFVPDNKFGYGMDVKYSAEGSRLENPDDTTVSVLHYIRVPVKLIYYFGRYENDFHPKCSIGPTIGFLVNEAHSYGAKNVDLGVSGSAGFNYRLFSTTFLSIDFNYYQGFIDVYGKTSNKELNSNFGFNVGVIFGMCSGKPG